MEKRYCPYCMSPIAEGESCPACGRLAEGYEPLPHHLPAGTVLTDRYLLGAVIGEGGFGITYIGLDLLLKIKVAIKEYYPRDRAIRTSAVTTVVNSFTGNAGKGYEKGKRRFIEEARIMARMEKQSAIVGVRDFFESNNTAYIVMEFVEGATLSQLVERRGGRILPAELLGMVEPLFGALSDLHGMGLIHRDISPDNIMLEKGAMRLLDFGCARDMEASDETLNITLRHGYAPVEQYRNSGQGPWTDVYALSATLYYCLTGIVPPQSLERLMEESLVLPNKIGVPLSELEERALLWGMGIQPKDRPQSIEQLYGALYKGDPVPPPLPDSDPVPPPPPPPPPKPKRRRALIALLALLIVASVALILWPTWDDDGGIRPFVRELLATPTPAPTATPEPTATPTPVPKTTDTPESTPILPGMGEPIDWAAFSGATILPAGSYDRAYMRQLMDDESVPSVVLLKGVRASLCNPDDGLFAVTKPIWVQEGATLQAGFFSVGGEGLLKVEGELDCQGLIMLKGEGTKLYIAGELTRDTAENTVILMDKGANLSFADAKQAQAMGNRLQINPQRHKNVVSVTSWEELKAALEEEQDLSIDTDITLEGVMEIHHSTVWISDGVTVTHPAGEIDYNAAVGRSVLIMEDGTLVNNGTILGDVLTVDQGAVFYNYGTLTGSEAYRNMSPIWLQNDALMINFGVFDAGHFSRLWDDSFMVNVGTVNAYNFILVGVNLVNAGTITALEDDGNEFGLLQCNNSVLYNKGVITVYPGGRIFNDSRLINDGRIEAISGEDDPDHKTATIDGYIENRGEIRGRADAAIWATVFGTGNYDHDGNTDAVSWLTAASLIPQDAVTVRDADQLRSAMQEEQPIVLTGEISLSSPLTIDNPLYICGTLSAGADATLTVTDGVPVILCEGGSLNATELLLEGGGSQMTVTEGSSLTIAEGGTLSMDYAIINGRDGTVNLKGARLVMSASRFVPDRLESLILDDASIDMTGSIFMMPYQNAMEISNLRWSIIDSDAVLPSDTELTGANITIDGKNGASLRVTGKNVQMKDCAVTVEDGGTLSVDYSNINLTGNTRLVNRGETNFSTWDEHMLRVADDARIINEGEMFINMKWIIRTPIDNQGMLVTHRKEELTMVMGNPVISEPW